MSGSGKIAASPRGRPWLSIKSIGLTLIFLLRVHQAGLSRDAVVGTPKMLHLVGTAAMTSRAAASEQTVEGPHWAGRCPWQKSNTRIPALLLP